MALFEWKDSYSVQIESIDNQHIKIVDYINELHDGMMSGKGKEVLGPVLSGLVSYTVEHFNYEEDLFARHEYSQTAEHKIEHEKLITKVSDFKEKFDSGSASISGEIMNFLKDWLMDHILKTDMKYSSYLIEKGVK